MGPAIYRHTKIITFKSNLLYVQVNDPMWKSELTLNKHRLIKKINALFPQAQLKDIIFSYHPFKARPEASPPPLPSPPYLEAARTKVIKKELEKEYESLPPSISPELKKSLAKLKLTWSKVRQNPPPDIFFYSTDPVDSRTIKTSSTQFVDYYFPLNSIRSEFLNFSPANNK